MQHVIILAPIICKTYCKKDIIHYRNHLGCSIHNSVSVCACVHVCVHMHVCVCVCEEYNIMTI